MAIRLSNRIRRLEQSGRAEEDDTIPFAVVEALLTPCNGRKPQSGDKELIERYRPRIEQMLSQLPESVLQEALEWVEATGQLKIDQTGDIEQNDAD